MVYRELLYDNGGVRFDRDNSAPGECSVLNVGLGGAGIRCLAAVREKLGEENAEAGRYVRYLAVDVDRDDLRLIKESAADGYEQRFFIGVSEHDDRRAPVRAFPWYNIADAGAPIGFSDGYRQTGRAMLLLKRPEMIHRLRTAIGHITGDGANTTRINIFAGSGGGTGSGALIDLCYIVKTVLREMSLAGAKVYVYLAMPDVYFTGALNLNGFAAQAQFVKANAYALFKELDYCMGFNTNGGEWDVDCGYYHESFNEPPADVCYLVSSCEMNGCVANVGVYETVSDHVIGEAFSTAEPFGGNRYAVIGSASSGVDIKAVYNYLGALTFKDMSEFSCEEYNSDSTSELARELRLTLDALCKELTDGVDDSFPIPTDIDWRNFREMEPGETIPGAIEHHFRKMYWDKLNDLQGNIYKMTNDRTNLDSPFKRVERKIEEMLTDTKKGPAYAVSVLKSNNAEDDSLIGVVEYNIERVRLTVTEYVARFDNCRRNVHEARREFDSPSLFRSNKARMFEEFLNCVSEQFKVEYYLNVFHCMEKILLDLMDRLCRYRKYSVMPCAEVVAKLMYTFNQNLARLENSYDDAGRHFVGLQDIKGLLVNVEYYDCKNEDLGRFYSELYKLVSERGRNEEEIIEFACAFINGLFTRYKDTDLYQYMQWKHRTSDPIIIRGIYATGLEAILSYSEPKYCVSVRRQDEERYVKLLVPANDTVANNAASNYMWHFDCPAQCTPIPLQQIAATKTVFGYGLKDYSMIDQLADSYRASSNAVHHLYSELARIPEIV